MLKQLLLARAAINLAD